jgi:hypothetical protein
VRRAPGECWLPALALAGTAAAASSPTVDVSELAHCAAIVAVDQRLACYDALAVSKMPPAPAATAAKQAAGAAATGSAAAVAATPAAAAAAPSGFGMSTHAAPIEQAMQQIVAHVVSGSVDGLGKVFVALDNGQSWTYSDAGGPPAPGSEVTIRRASLGSYLLTTPSHHTYRAQRTK